MICIHVYLCYYHTMYMYIYLYVHYCRCTLYMYVCILCAYRFICIVLSIYYQLLKAVGLIQGTLDRLLDFEVRCDLILSGCGDL